MSRDDDQDDGFLTRWSRRKRQVRQGNGPGAGHDQQSVTEKASGTEDAAQAIEPELDLSKLPKIEELTAETDISVFLKKGVPEELRRLALRKAWALDPAIRDFVEVAENQYNWNLPDGVPGFGPLAPDTDLAALLAQATGQVMPPPENAARSLERAQPVIADPVAGVAPPTPEKRPDLENVIGEQKPEAKDEQARPEAVQNQGLHEGEPVETSEQPTQVQSTDSLPVRRRRHGGALPG